MPFAFMVSVIEGMKWQAESFGNLQAYKWNVARATSTGYSPDTLEPTKRAMRSCTIDVLQCITFGSV
jgi:hypothetical protein